MSLVDPMRRFRFGTSCGSKVPLRSRGTTISAGAGDDGLGGETVAGVPATLPGRVAAVVAEMIGHLHIQPTFQNGLDHPVDQPIRAVYSNPHGLGIGQQRIDPSRIEQLSKPLTRRIRRRRRALLRSHRPSLRV